MSDQQDKSEEATPYKLEEARKKGQVPRSPDLLSFAMVMTFLMVFSAIVAPLASVIATHCHWWLSNAGQLGGNFGYLGEQGGYSLKQVVYAFLPLVGARMLVAILTNLRCLPHEVLLDAGSFRKQRCVVGRCSDRRIAGAVYTLATSKIRDFQNLKLSI